jgi:hypothetical protein
MTRLIFASIFFLVSLPTFAGDDSGRQQCIKECSSAKNSELSRCDNKTGDERNSCKDKAAQDNLECSSRCDSKYPVK